ncbi:MAG: DNRLRE domain-containing protein [Actinomycetota bacterium]
MCVQALSGAGLDRGPRIRAVQARADAFVSAESRTQNFGRTRGLKVDSSPTLQTYIAFDVDLKSGDVQRVSLMLYSRKGSRVGYEVRLVRERFREREITFANAPGLSGDIVMSGPLRARAWKTVDLTSLVSGQGKYVGVVLTSLSPRGITFASRETGLHGPRLIVEREPKGTTTTGTTQTSTQEVRVP